VRIPQRLARLGIADGVMVAVLIWRWASSDGPHHLIDAATVFTLLLGFLGVALSALRSLRSQRRRDAVLDAERRGALLLFPAEGSGAAGPSKGTAQPTAEHSPWFTLVAYSTLMIALMWRWAVLGEPYTGLGTVTLSILMLGFLRATATTVERLGRPGPTLAWGHRNEQQDALLHFPAEEAVSNHRAFAPPVLATRRNALL
jgi:hypothetical protein